jgi:hypothetical protein
MTCTDYHGIYFHVNTNLLDFGFYPVVRYAQVARNGPRADAIPGARADLLDTQGEAIQVERLPGAARGLFFEIARSAGGTRCRKRAESGRAPRRVA